MLNIVLHEILHKNDSFIKKKTLDTPFQLTLHIKFKHHYVKIKEPLRKTHIHMIDIT